MQYTDAVVWEAKHKAGCVTDHDRQFMLRRLDDRRIHYDNLIRERKKTGNVNLFVNEFYRWSRLNPPSPDEREWLDTPEVMDLQWCRYVASLLDPETWGPMTTAVPESETDGTSTA